MDYGRRAVRMVDEMVRLVLLDIDGTLIRTGGAGIRAFARVSERLYGRPGGTSGLSFHGATDTGLVREYFQIHAIKDSHDERRRFLDTYLFWLDHHLNLNRGETCPGVPGFLAALRALEKPPLLGLLTGNIRLGAELKLRAHHLWHEFVVGGFADGLENRADIAWRARRLGEAMLPGPVADAEVLVVGDTPADVACGRAIGARCLAVATGGAALPVLQAALPDWCVADFREVDAAKICS